MPSAFVKRVEILTSEGGGREAGSVEGREEEREGTRCQLELKDGVKCAI